MAQIISERQKVQEAMVESGRTLPGVAEALELYESMTQPPSRRDGAGAVPHYATGGNA